MDSEPRSSGITWIDAFARSLAAPPVGAVVAPDLIGRDDAVLVAADQSGRPVLRLRAPTMANRRALGVLDGALGAEVTPGGAFEALVAAAAGGTIVALDAHGFDDETIGVLVDLVPQASSVDVGLLVASRPAPASPSAELIAAVAAHGPVVRDVTLTVDDIGAHLARRVGGAVPTALVHDVRALTEGRLGLVDLLVDAAASEEPGRSGDALRAQRGVALETLVEHVRVATSTAPVPASSLPTSAGATVVVGGTDLSAGGPVPAATAMVARAATALSVHLDRLAVDERRLLVAWSLLPDAGDELLDAALGDRSAHADALVTLRRALGVRGLLADDGASVVPLVNRLLRTAVDPAELRDARRRVAQALAGGHGAPEAVAAALLAAGATGAETARAYLAAARAVGHRDPTTAQEWFDAAVAAGAEAAGCAAERGELTAIAGDRTRARDLLTVAFTGPAGGAAATARLAGVLAWRDGHGDRAARHLADATAAGDPQAAALAAVVHLAIGSASPVAPEELASPPAVSTEVDAGLWTLVVAAEAAVSGDLQEGLTGLLEAAALLEGPPTPLALPELVSVMAAATALTIGDRTMAAAVLDRTAPDGGGGLHQLSRRGWQDLIGVLDGRAPTGPPESSTHPAAARDGLLAAAVAAGWARRTSDVAALHDAWCRAEPLLVTVQPDLWLMHPSAELAAAAARLDTFDRAARWLDSIDAALDRIAATPPWRASLAWARLGAAVAANDVDGAGRAADALAALDPLDGPLRALEPAARCWVQVLGSEPDEQMVLDAADGLDAAGRRSDAARLVGQAAVRVSQPAVARRLLARARELGDLGSLAPRPDQAGGLLSERELEVARLVVDGHTYKQIGAQLYVSPKTVEHHVARIRTKLGAADRAEMLAALRRELRS